MPLPAAQVASERKRSRKAVDQADTQRPLLCDRGGMQQHARRDDRYCKTFDHGCPPSRNGSNCASIGFLVAVGGAPAFTRTKIKHKFIFTFLSQMRVIDRISGSFGNADPRHIDSTVRTPLPARSSDIAILISDSGRIALTKDCRSSRPAEQSARYFGRSRCEWQLPRKEPTMDF